ncbi:MAG: hypothetical protein C5S38_02855 [Candidatus Methanophagaceae archaeon]|nr:MAG: hypothetical protein C5S38_02855 [Methanophagales archaeon]
MNEDINIILSLSSLNTLINNTASYSGTGIHLQDSSDNMLLNNTASENAYGIYLLSSCDNNLTGNIANSNTGEYGGISMVSDSNDNTLTSNNVSDNSQYGIYLFLSCNNNISCNNVNSNSNYGIYLDDSNNNLIYNNYFNNTNNAYDNGTNVWNITNTTGPNIIGGSWLGGNYWSDYAGIDNDGDGLGDIMLPHNSSSGIQQGGDWHPLTEVATSLPDLEITDLRVCWSDNCRICYNLTNIGTGTALAGHNTSLFVESVEKAYDCVDTALDPNESYIGCFDGYNWSYTQPEDNLTVCADCNETIDERNETNNCLNETWKCGDVNGDGIVSMSDALAIVSENIATSEWAADVNHDHVVSMSDALAIVSENINCCCE